MQDDFVTDALEARDIAAIAACLGIQLFSDNDIDVATIDEPLLEEWLDKDVDK